MTDLRQPRKRPLVIVCGPIADDGKPAGGGYQSGNRRTIKLLRELGYETKEFAYPEGASTLFGKFISYVMSFSRIGLKLLATRHRPASFHITPLFRHFIAAEYAVCVTAKLLGMKLIVDLRAGSQITHFASRSFVYQAIYRKLIRLADAIAFEGEPYGEFVRSIAPKAPRFFLPNFVDVTTISVPALPRADSGPRLVYVGRVSEAKGAVHAALTLEKLQKKYPDASLTLIGPADEQCKKKIVAANVGNVEFTGPLAPEDIRTFLDQSHYFVFLTKWWGEGHSNALTEAMGRGCVPIYTVHGFNDAVVGDTGVRIGERDNISDIADHVVAHWLSGTWQQSADRASARVLERFSDVVARSTLREMHDRLFEVNT